MSVQQVGVHKVTFF